MQEACVGSNPEDDPEIWEAGQAEWEGEREYHEGHKVHVHQH